MRIPHLILFRHRPASALRGLVFELAYRRFCRLGLEDQVPRHSTVAKEREAASATAISAAMSSRLWAPLQDAGLVAARLRR